MKISLLKKIKFIIDVYILENHPLAKLICLIISIILFSYVHFELQVSPHDIVEYKMPIQIKNVPLDFYIMSIDSKDASILFSGEKKVFANVIDDISIYVDVENAKEGVNQYSLSIGNASILPPNTEFTLTPKYINVDFKKIGSVE